MNSVGTQAIDKMSQVINNAANTQHSITAIVTFDEILHKEIQKIKARERNKNQERNKENKLDFNPNEIQTLVYRNKEGSER